MRILAVDDSEVSRQYLEAALFSGGYKDVRTADSAAAVFQLLRLGAADQDEPPDFDVILLDIVMPEIDGIVACATIHNDPRHADVPIIMVTSLQDMESLGNAFVAGATDYIVKPVNRVELLARVRTALKLKAELERRQARERELLQFLSTWGDRRATVWVDPVTGVLVGEVVEAYLIATAHADEPISILALAVDRLDAFRASQGEAAVRDILARVARGVRNCAATIGTVAAAYRDGLIVLIAPELDAAAAQRLGEALRTAVSELAIANSEAIAADHLTASVAVVSGNVRRGLDRAHLLIHAISIVKDTASAGNRVIAVNLQRNGNAKDDIRRSA